MPTFDDPPTPADEQAAADNAAQDAYYAAELEQREQDVLEALAERDAALKELAKAREELDRLRLQRAWATEARYKRAQGQSGLLPRSNLR
jgi:hypothetical protein